LSPAGLAGKAAADVATQNRADGAKLFRTCSFAGYKGWGITLAQRAPSAGTKKRISTNTIDLLRFPAPLFLLSV